MSGTVRVRIEDRFMAKVDKTDAGCWEWQGYCSPSGYGRFGVVGANGPQLAHRVGYELFVGSIPDELTLDHLCRNTRCVNPEHLEPVTLAENRRRAAAAMTHCKNGHPKTPENTYVIPKTGARDCKVCRRVALLAFHERRRMAEAV